MNAAIRDFISLFAAYYSNITDSDIIFGDVKIYFSAEA